MSNGNQPSASVASGTSTSPDERVNYEFGLVLGVNEFRQEQDYFLQKDYLYNRELHGYGTVSGLQVTADRLPAKDVQITVKPGLALDQFGRPVVLRSDQCAHLGAWLAKHADEIANHPVDDSGYMHVYVVVSYSECMDALVPVAGQLCNTGNGSSPPVPSRIRDAYMLEFRWDPPAMPAWDAVRTFAKLLSQVRIRPGVDSNEEDILEQVRQIGQSDIVDQVWYLPSETAREALDRIFTVWVTEVRPTLAPDLLDPGASEAGILLARIDFTLDDGAQSTNGIVPVTDFKPPSNDGRPFLLHTQLIDELLLLGRRDARMKGSAAYPERDFATLSVRNNRTLQAWVHHPVQLKLYSDDGDWSDQLEVKCEGTTLAIANVTQVAVSGLENVFEVEIAGSDSDTNPLIMPGSRVEVIFHADGIAVAGDEDDEEDENPVEEVAEEVGEGVERVGEAVERGVERVGEEVEEAAGEGVKLVGEGVEDVGKGIAKLGKAVEKRLGRVGKDVEEAGQDVEHAGEAVEGAGQRVIAAAEEEEAEDDDDTTSLQDSIDDLGIDYVGYDRDESVIAVYTIAEHRPTRDLVTFFTYDARADSAEANVPHAELREVVEAERFLALWFHTEDPVKLPQQVQVQRIFINQQPQTMMFKATPPQGSAFSFFWALEPPTGQEYGPLAPGELLTVTFDTNGILIGGEDASERFTDAMKEQYDTFAGYDNDHTIEVHHQVSFPRREREREEGPPPPTLPFVTITRLSGETRSEAAPDDTQARHVTTGDTFELWFHLTPDPADDIASFNEELAFEVLLELGDLRRRGRVEPDNTTFVQLNIAHVTLTLPQPEANRPAHYLRFKFPLDRNPVSIRNGPYYQNLGEYMRRTGIRFEGFNGRDAVVAYTRVPAGRGTHESSR